MKNKIAVVVTPNTGGTSVQDVVSGIIDYVLPFIGGVLMLMVIYGGFLLMTSGGDPEKVTKGRKTLTWAIVGVILIVISYSIVVALNNVVNTNIL